MPYTCIYDALYISPDVISIFICLFTKLDWTVDSEVLMEEGRGREPHPVPCIQAPVCI